MSTPALADGSVFANRYRIVRCLARGGMGAVYEVIHLDTKRRRALKAMHGHILHSEELRERFHREARVAAEVESDFIVDVFDTGVDEATGMPFLCMELLRGEELSRRLKRLGRLPEDEVALFLHQTALALDKTHQASIVHRDLKPENLFVTEREDGPPRIKVLDFGIAKVIADGANSASTTLSIGTPLYMSPEQFTPRARLNGASDIYALGMIAYTCLVGAPYWDEDSRVGNVFAFGAIARLGPVEPATARAARRGVTLPAGFDEWFARVTNVDPEARFSPATSATRALAELLGSPVLSGARASLGSPTSGRDVSSPSLTPVGITPVGATPSGITPVGATPSGSTPPNVTPLGGAARPSPAPAAPVEAPRGAAPAAKPEAAEMPRLFEDQDDATLVYANRGAAAEALRALNIELPGMGMTQVIVPKEPAAKPAAPAVATPAPAVATPAPAATVPAAKSAVATLPPVVAPPMVRPAASAATAPAASAVKPAGAGARASRPLPVVVPPARPASPSREPPAPAVVDPLEEQTVSMSASRATEVLLDPLEAQTAAISTPRSSDKPAPASASPAEAAPSEAAPSEAAPASEDPPARPPAPAVKLASLTPSATVLPTPAQRVGSLPDIPIPAEPPARRNTGIVIAILGALLFAGICAAILSGKREPTMITGDAPSAAPGVTASPGTK